MPDIKVLLPDGTPETYHGINSISVDSASENGEKVKYIYVENPITLLIDDVDYTVENSTVLESGEEYTIQI